MLQISSALFRRASLVSGLVLTLASPSVWAQSAVNSFDPNANGNVVEMARQPDGKIIVAGSFWSLTPNNTGALWDRSRIGRLNANGTVDRTFWAGFNDDVSAILIQPDGKVVVAGKFTTVHTLAAPDPVARNGLARLESDGRLDMSFDPNPMGMTFPLAAVRAMALQPDGKIIVAGGFTSFQPNQTGDAIPRNRLARLNPDGSVDPAFDPNANNVVLALALQSDGKVVVGGGFTALQPNGASAAIEHGRLARLNADGTVDSSFVVDLDNRVLALAVQGDGSILVGGDFTYATFGAQGSPTPLPRLLRVDANGARDTSFDSVVNGAVHAFGLRPDGRILIGGSFNSVVSLEKHVSSTRAYIASLFPDGSLDTSFAPFPNAPVESFLVEPDGSIIIGGTFTGVQGVGDTQVQLRRRLARLRSNGSLDTGFVASNGGTIRAVAVDADGNTLYGGSFISFAGETHNAIVRVGPDGVIDSGFAPDFNGTVTDVVVQPDGKLLVSGSFTKVGSVSAPFLVRLNPDGTLDTAFDPNPSSTVIDIALQSDGKILIGGSFTAVNPNSDDTANAVTRRYIARINSDGTLDTAFDPNASSSVTNIAVRSDGKILIGGSFTALRPGDTGDSISRSYLALLTSAGEVDPDFNVSLNGVVSDLALQSDGKLIIVGSFNAIAAVNATEASTRAGIARLNEDGTLDTAFDPGPNAAVGNVAVLADGTIAISGSFNTLAPNEAEDTVSRLFFAWLNADGTSPDSKAYGFDSIPTVLVAQGNSLFVGGNFSRITPLGGNAERVEGGIVRFALDGSRDTAFVPGSSPAVGYVGSVTEQAGGRFLIGGSFERLGGSFNENLSRINNDGTPDTSFFAKVDGPVHAVVTVPSDASLVDLGGPAALLNPAGRFLETFDPADTSLLSGTAFAVARQSDGKLLVGGSISHSEFGVGSYLMRFNADGSIDTSFAPRPGNNVRTIAVQSDGKIVVGGEFTTIGGISRDYLARLNNDGTVDTTFDPNPNSSVAELRILSDGKILVGGSFTTFQPNGAESSSSRPFLARLNVDGTVDTTFTPAFNGSAEAITIQDDGKLLIGGTFTTVNSTSRPYLVRLAADGALDDTFSPTPNSTVAAIAVQDDGKILIGGRFTTLQPDPDVDPVSVAFLGRLNADGTHDDSFLPGPAGVVTSIGIQSDGRILVGGAFGYFLPPDAEDPIYKSRLARLNPDGTFDVSYNPVPDSSIETIVVFPDDTFAVGGSHTLLFPQSSLYVGGSFSSISDTPAPYLARLFDNGVVDVNLEVVPNGVINALATQPDRGVVFAGNFTEVSDTARGYIGRITPAGNLDTDFDPMANGEIKSVLILPDGKLLVGGTFTSIGGGAAQGIARLNTDGTLDGAFSASVDGPVAAMVQQGDGKILVGGDFSLVDGAARPYMARLTQTGALDAGFAPVPDAAVASIALQGDGKIVIGGAFTSVSGTPRRGIARLRSDGSLEAAYQADTDGDVYALLLQQDGGLVVGGNFTQVADGRRRLVARLSPISAATRVISVDSALDAATFTVGGSSGDFAYVTFDYSTDANTWTSLGSAQRTGQLGEWRITGLALPPASPYYLRASGYVASSRYGSGSARQVSAQFFGATPAVSFGLNSQAGGASGSGGSGSGSSGSGDGTETGGSGSGSDSGSGSASGGAGSGNTGDGQSGGIAVDGSGVVNLSGRGAPGADSPLITGFVVKGTGTQSVLLRAVGPTLSQFGVSDPMAQPVLRVYDQAGNLVDETASWSGDATLQSMFGTVGAFSLEPGSDDAAVVLALAPGPYTVHVRDGGAAGGIALGEIYLVPGETSTGALANVSLRGPVGAGDAVLVAGFVVSTDEPQSLLIRGVGPALAGFGVTDALADPTLRVFDASGTEVAENNDWLVQSDGSGATMAARMAETGAFAFPADSHDSAVIVTLGKGAYTVQVSGTSTGSALIEVYAAP